MYLRASAIVSLQLFVQLSLGETLKNKLFIKML